MLAVVMCDQLWACVAFACMLCSPCLYGAERYVHQRLAPGSEHMHSETTHMYILFATQYCFQAMDLPARYTDVRV